MECTEVNIKFYKTLQKQKSGTYSIPDLYYFLTSYFFSTSTVAALFICVVHSMLMADFSIFI